MPLYAIHSDFLQFINNDIGDTWTYVVEMALFVINVIYDPEMIV